MTADPAKAQRLIALTQRLTEALEADIAALERGRPRELRTPQADVQQLTALYTREAASFAPSTVHALPKPEREHLTLSTQRFRDVLTLHGRILSRVRSCTEGMVRAIADDVATKRNASRPYAATPAAKPRPPGAILFNNVV